MSDEEDYDEDFEDYDDDFEDEEEEEVEEPAPPPAPPAPAPVAPVQKPVEEQLPPRAATPKRPTQEDQIAQAMAAENNKARVLLASRGSQRGSNQSLTGTVGDSHSSMGDIYGSPRDDYSSRPASRAGSYGNPAKDNQPLAAQLPERKSLGLPSKGDLKAGRDSGDGDGDDKELQRTKARVKRWKDITAIIKMKEVAIDDIFNQPPLSLRELCDLGRGVYAGLYIKGCQTNEDASTVETQTEEMETRRVAVQAPEDLGLSRDVLERQADASKRRHKALPGWVSTAGALQGDHTRRLNKFLAHFGPIVDTLLLDRSKKEVPIFQKASAQIGQKDSLSSHTISLNYDKLLQGRQVQDAAFSTSGSQSLVLCPYTIAENGLDVHSSRGRGVSLVWDLSSLSEPLHVLSSEGEPQCCCWSPDNPYFAIAGMAEGGICLWDLREPAGQHPTEEGGVVWRRPTYSTEFNCDLEEIVGGVVALRATRSQQEEQQPEHQDAMSSRSSFQLVSLDSWSNVAVWLVAEMSNADIAGSDVDFGLRIGGRVKILHVTNVQQYGPQHAIPLNLPGQAEGSSSCEDIQPSTVARLAVGGSRGRVRRTWDLAVFPAAPNEFVVAGDQGMVLRGSRFGVTPVPRQYSLSDPALGSRFSNRYVSRTTSLHFSPFFPDFFLAAYDPATIALYKVDTGLALVTWKDITSCDILSVRWSPVKPSLFFALDADSVLYVFDLLSSKPNKPVHTENFASGQRRVTSIEMSASSSNPDEISKIEHAFVLAHSDGQVTVHKFGGQYTPNINGNSSGYDQSACLKEMENYLNTYSSAAGSTEST